MSTLHLRPRGFSELIDATFQIVRARFRVLATGGAFIMLPVMVLSLLMLLYMPQPQLGPNGTMVQAAAADPPAGIWVAFLAAGLASIWAFVVGFAALVDVASRAYLGEAMELATAIAHARERFWTLLGATISKYALVFFMFIAAGIVAALFAAAVPALGLVAVLGVFVLSVVLLVMWSVTTPVVMLENARSGDALARSAILTHGSRFRLFAVFAVLVVLVWTATGTVMMVGMVLVQSPLVAQVFGNLVSLVMYPFAAVLVTVVYYDLRIRSEGFDLELMAAGLERDAVLPAGNAAGHAAGGSSRQPA